MLFCNSFNFKLTLRKSILINNAGIFAPKPAEEMEEKEWQQTLEINLKGQFLCAQRCTKEMKKNNWGRIINISSIASGEVGIGFPNAAHYTASKGGIKGLTETLAVEWADYDINVNAIAPGAIKTPMTEDVNTEELLDDIPLGRIGEPEEVSKAVLFLASKEASYITGTTLYVDGGWMAS
ncbi:MAG: SDR family NAD(P)-dependent oxidoreductase [Candidatus Magasanikbacteria bacterium]